jgi:hypothetical protein
MYENDKLDSINKNYQIHQKHLIIIFQFITFFIIFKIIKGKFSRRMALLNWALLLEKINALNYRINVYLKKNIPYNNLC